MSCAGTEKNGPWWLQAVAMCGLLAVACMGVEPGPGAREPSQEAPRQEAASEEDPAARVAIWVLGKHQRMVRRKVRAAARLLVLPQQGPSRPLINDCVHASSLLPSRARPGTVFLIMGGGLHVVDTGAARPAIAPIPIRPANVVLVELLALSKQASPAELIVLARPAGAQRGRGIDSPRGSASPATLPSAAGTPPPRLWRLVVKGDRATGSPVDNAPWLRSREAFFERFHAPRCRDDGSDCLMVADGDRGAFLDVQPKPRTPRHEWKKLEAGTIHDASWNPADQSSALALVACDEQSP